MIAKPEAFGLIQLVIGSRLAVQLIGSERFCCARAIAQSGVVVEVSRVVIKCLQGKRRENEFLSYMYNIAYFKGVVKFNLREYGQIMSYVFLPRSTGER